jgi:predicted DsbA family dithiol-disulfide isomerase
VHPEIWVRNRTASSLPAHLVLAAVRLLRDRGELEGRCADDHDGRCAVEEAAWRIRLAFFRDLEDVARMDVLEQAVAGIGVPPELVREEVASGRAFAALARDAAEHHHLHIDGSPTFILDGGRQKLYGNLSVQVLRANVSALLSG